MKSKSILLTLCALTVFFSLSAQEIKTTPFGKGILNIVGKDSTWSMKFAARFQLLSSVNWQEGEETTSNFLVRRARLKFDGFVMTPRLKYKLELGLSNRDISGTSIYTGNTPRYILDAVVKWNFYNAFELWFGQTKLPGNRERVISSGDLQFVDRSILNAKFNIDRDIGLQLRNTSYIGETFILREVFSFSQGEGRNIVNGNLGGYQYTGRLEALPFGAFTKKGDYSGSDLLRESSPKLSIGVTYDLNNNAVKTRSNLGSYMVTDVGFHETDISTTFVDAMFKYKGISFMGEYAYRDSDDPVAKNSDGTLTGDIVDVGSGLNLQIGYLFKSNFEIATRYSSYNAKTEITGREDFSQYTLGFSRYFVGHKLKVQTDFNYLTEVSTADNFLWRFQIDVHF